MLLPEKTCTAKVKMQFSALSSDYSLPLGRTAALSFKKYIGWPLYSLRGQKLGLKSTDQLLQILKLYCYVLLVTKDGLNRFINIKIPTSLLIWNLAAE